MRWASPLRKPLVGPPAAKVPLEYRSSSKLPIHMASCRLLTSPSAISSSWTLTSSHTNDTTTSLHTTLWRRRALSWQELILQTTSSSSSKTTWQAWDVTRWVLRAVGSPAWIYMTYSKWAHPKTRENSLSTNNYYLTIKTSSTYNKITTTASPVLHLLVLTTELILCGASQAEASGTSFRSWPTQNSEAQANLKEKTSHLLFPRSSSRRNSQPSISSSTTNFLSKLSSKKLSILSWP